jgi:hypothetical protein
MEHTSKARAVKNKNIQRNLTGRRTTEATIVSALLAKKRGKEAHDCRQLEL